MYSIAMKGKNLKVLPTLIEGFLKLISKSFPRVSSPSQLKHIKCVYLRRVVSGETIDNENLSIYQCFLIYFLFTVFFPC